MRIGEHMAIAKILYPEGVLAEASEARIVYAKRL